MKIGIVGYGNLGKAVEKIAEENKNFEIVGIFSRRNIKANHQVYPLKSAIKFKNKIDIMIMCGGSEKDLMIQTPTFAKNFNVIDTFDTHNLSTKHFENVDKICKESQTSAIVCCGWDPGLFSCLRAVFGSIFDNVNCFYGKGISLGHTNAIKKIKGVIDAKQYTLVNKKTLKQAKANKPVIKNKHIRKCFVVATKNKKLISKQIKNIPNYFKGEKTKIRFVSQKTLLKKHNTFAHQGQIIATDENSSLFLKLKMKSNPIFTAKILLAYCTALSRIIEAKVFKAFTPLSIPFCWLYDKDQKSIIKELC